MKAVQALRNSTFITAAWGFLAIVITGEYNVFFQIACLGSVTILYALARAEILIPRWLPNLVAIIAFCICLMLIGENLLDAVVYLFSALQLVKLASLRKPEDVRWVYVITLFQVVGSAVLTTTMSFAVIFLGYLVLIITSLTLYVLVREARRAERINTLSQSHAISDIAKHEVPAVLTVSRTLLGTCVVATIIVGLLSLLTFSVIPRVASQNLFQRYGTPPPEEEQLSGFDESIEFGSLAQINLDSSVAMFVQPESKNVPDHIRLRGVALDTFDGRTWTRTTPNNRIESGLHAISPIASPQFPKMETRIIQPPGITKYLFAPTFPDEFVIPRDHFFHYDHLAQSLWLVSPSAKELQYKITSSLELPELRKDPEKHPKIIARRVAFGNPEMPEDRPALAESFQNLVNKFSQRDGLPLLRDRLPPVSDEARAMELRQYYRQSQSLYLAKCTTITATLNSARLRSLAENWISDAEAVTRFDKAVAIEERLRTQYEYTLSSRSRGNFIEDFLFNTQAGHCEYFASGMVLLLRSVEIPARVVNGFYSVEWNTIGNNFTVRQRDAHSWVEVYLGDKYGWMTFDPTPASGVGRPLEQNAVSRIYNRLSDAVRVRWYRYVIDYSLDDQTATLRAISNGRNRLSAWMQAHGSKQLAEMFRNKSDFGGALTIVMYIVFFLTIIALAIGTLKAMQRIWRRYRLKHRPQSVIKFYAILIRRLERLGLHLGPGQTPREFAAEVSKIPSLEDFAEVTEMYYRSRYESILLGETELNLLEHFQRQIKVFKKSRGSLDTARIQTAKA